MKEKLERLSAIGFKRISDKLEILWGSLECQKYLYNLIVMDREGRTGFPNEVFDLIVSLSNIHMQEFRFDDPRHTKFGPFRKI